MRAAGVVAVVAVGALAANAAAAPADLRVSVAPDACPSPAQLAGALAKAMPGARVLVDPAGAIELIDLGPAYRVTVAGAAREFADSRRRCDERARAAAVYIALTLEQRPLPPEPPPAPVAVPVPVPVPVSGPGRPRSFFDDVHVDAEVFGAPMFGLGGSALARGATAGIGAHAVVSWRYLGIVLGGTAMVPAGLQLAANSASTWRVPLDVGVRGQLRWRRLEGALDLGVAVGPSHIEGQGFSVDTGDTVADAGFRAALLARLWLVGRLAAYVGVESVVGASRPLKGPNPADPSNSVVGETPAAWLAVELGLALRIR